MEYKSILQIHAFHDRASCQPYMNQYYDIDSTSNQTHVHISDAYPVRVHRRLSCQAYSYLLALPLDEPTLGFAWLDEPRSDPSQTVAISTCIRVARSVLFGPTPKTDLHLRGIEFTASH